MTETFEITIEALGAHGDGIAATETGSLFVSGALPGERVRVSVVNGHAQLQDRLTTSTDRQTPPCRHFGHCGGCAVQHIASPAYAAWKRDVVMNALAHRGIATPVDDLIVIPAASRRRAVFGLSRRDDVVALGFREEGRHTLVPITECHVLVPAIATALPALAEVAMAALRNGDSGRLVVTMLDNGLDVSIETGRIQPAPALRAELAALAAQSRLVRLSIDAEPLITRERPILTVAGVSLSPPVGIFLQASAEAERVITRLVTTAVGTAKSIADLFCGIGTLTFPLARKARVFAADTDGRSIETLRTALRAAPGLKPVETRARDLFREPLSRTELSAFDAVVFDPPRAGAKAQCEALARSKVPRIVAVSCNPATLARDLRILIDGGYRVTAVTPIDQFVYTPHVETVAVLTR